jgi:hypothetical protein
MYHVELRQFPHVVRIFNLSREELDTRFVRPWINGAMIEHDDRRWAPERSRLKILEGPRLRAEEMGMGRGWAAAAKSATDVTDALMAEARRGAEARPELEALKAAVQEVAAQPISFQDVMALAGAAHPTWRASEQLALAEQAVWEMLHQNRLTMVVAGEPVDRARWQPVVLSWATWAGAGEESFALQAPPQPVV